MGAFVLDTDTVSLYQRGHARVVAAISGHSTDLLAVCSVTLEEQISGWSTLARTALTPLDQERASMFLTALVVSWNKFALVPLTVSGVTRFEQLVRAKLNVKRNDLRIAAINLELGATIVTRNRRDFGRIPGLAIEEWSL